MQIWFLDPSPARSAEILYKKSPKRARKYVIEFTQACAFIFEKNKWALPIRKDGKPYKTALASRFPKPLMTWLQETPFNLMWAFSLARKITFLDGQPLSLDGPNYGLIMDYLKREFGKCDYELVTPFPNYAKSKEKGLDFTHLPVHDAYRKYLNAQL